MVKINKTETVLKTYNPSDLCHRFQQTHEQKKMAGGMRPAGGGTDHLGIAGRNALKKP